MQLAERMGRKPSYIGRIESKPAKLTLKRLARLAAAGGAALVIRFERGEAPPIDVRIPAAAMLAEGRLDRFE